MFRILARYIGVFGNPENKDTNKIAMTAPVLSTKTSSSKIAMTAPVLRTSANDMRFVLPKKFKTKEDAPQPTDTRVELIDVPERMVAVKTFSGLVSMDQSETMANEFKAALEAQGFICKGTFTNLVLEFEHKLQLTRINLFFSLVLFVFLFSFLIFFIFVDWMLARYNPPFTLWFLRTNEIWMTVDKDSIPTNEAEGTENSNL